MQSVIEISAISLPQKSRFGILFFLNPGQFPDSAGQLYRKVVSRTAWFVHSAAGLRMIYLG